MASITTAEKVFFNPQLTLLTPAGGGTEHTSADNPHRQYNTDRIQTKGTHRNAAAGQYSDRGTKSNGYPTVTLRMRDDRGSMKNLRRTVKNKTHRSLGRSHDKLPAIHRSGSFYVNKPLTRTQSDGTMDTHSLPPVASGKGLRFYGSHPALGEVGDGDDAPIPLDASAVGRSLPAGMELAGVARKDSFANIADNVKKRKVSMLPVIISSQVNCDPDGDYNTEVVDDQDMGSGNDRTSSDSSGDEPSIEKQAERDVEENWILQGELNAMDRQFERRKNNLSIAIADEDPMVIIEKRLQEVRQMTDRKRDKSRVLEKFKPEVRELIMVYIQALLSIKMFCN